MKCLRPQVALTVQSESTKERRLRKLRRELEAIEFPEEYQLPLDPDMVACGIKVDKCRVMESKKKPLWLNFIPPGDGGSFPVMFKAGDDLRQDQLTLQVLGIMNKMWLEEGLDLCMSPYLCISTGDEKGMLQVVQNSETLASIVGEYGIRSGKNKKPEAKKGANKGKSGRKMGAALDALYDTSALLNWLRHHNSEPEGSPDGAEPRLDDARRRFMLSCAGYCVATFVLGIGDRHNDNIMMKRTGELFHIDFGHFLGNFKSKYGIKRETAPFVFTPSMAVVLGGIDSELFAEFEYTACRAFLVLRRHTRLLVTLFSLMLSCGIPELQRESDIMYLRDRLVIHLTEEEAKTYFSGHIHKCLGDRMTTLNDAIHLYAHTS